MQAEQADLVVLLGDLFEEVLLARPYADLSVDVVWCNTHADDTAHTDAASRFSQRLGKPNYPHTR